ncbi:LptF/LptG family permease [Flavilitoribacter nigricans]|uniref:Permease n=1 Tax=Flavilitoribacter nigricans (strain ATCC 23147 / DSM 23189 / NBRC 102662 / NCIMB 1420 / SS-2) TaxID=1122177 RepID=A0A2D0NGA5_FLAN2|nr:LptF/LptG family permease [Flavilitoribacter nigricans]PHN07416.1 permease [Flavilitoribacter nigricans DSM 23189 = NBRC 102662]
MLKLADRYIIRKFLQTFLFIVLLFSLIVAVVDFSSKVSDFTEASISADQLLRQYYPNFIGFINGLLWPLYTLIAVIYFTSRLSANNEILAIFNMGVSLHRLLLPYLLCATLIAAFGLAANHYLIPNGNKKWLTLQYTYLTPDEDEGKTQNVHLFIAPDSKVYFRQYNKRDSTGTHFRLEEYQNQELVRLIKARNIEWIGPPDRWRLHHPETHLLRGLHQEVEHSGLPLDTSFNLVPDDFVDYKDQHFMFTTPELKRYIDRQKARGINNTAKYEAERYRRTADAFTIYVLTLLGMVIAGRKSRGGTGWHMALGLGLGAIFLFLSRFAIVFASGQIIPLVLGIWMPNLIFGGITLYLMLKAQQ